jgi:hypothetical protein
VLACNGFLAWVFLVAALYAEVIVSFLAGFMLAIAFFVLTG